ncbi:RING/U-box superfamily protein [Artemisia annua]|uniref:RING-type E3 ubiquitin transferase n=1 Tax=Artemisia annua TaxID=35608 RepID=A0A2U1LDD8_ARTAN|nr:RING/U-box superfamily protein [Artemisia annua]
MSSNLGNNRMDDPGMMEVTGKVLITTIIALVFVLIFVFLFNIYAKWLWSRRQQTLDSHNQHRNHQGQHAGVTVLRRGLDVAFLKTLPVVEFDPKEFKDGVLECSVCITEVEQGEKTRILPKCNHAFHAECIDMWFHSHSTCPICRNPVSEQTEVSVESLLEQEHSSTSTTSSTDFHTFPTNVLFWGDETEVSTLTSQLEEATNNQHPQAPVLPFEPTSSSSSNTNNDRLAKEDLVIDIPRNLDDEEDQKSPILSRMRSLRRILSSSSRRFNPFSPVSSNNNNVVAQGTTPQN